MKLPPSKQLKLIIIMPLWNIPVRAVNVCLEEAIFSGFVWARIKCIHRKTDKKILYTDGWLIKKIKIFLLSLNFVVVIMKIMCLLCQDKETKTSCVYLEK